MRLAGFPVLNMRALTFAPSTVCALYAPSSANMRRERGERHFSQTRRRWLAGTSPSLNQASIYLGPCVRNLSAQEEGDSDERHKRRQVRRHSAGNSRVGVDVPTALRQGEMAVRRTRSDTAEFRPEAEGFLIRTAAVAFC